MARTYKNNGPLGPKHSQLELSMVRGAPRNGITFVIDGDTGDNRSNSVMLSEAQARDLVAQITAVVGEAPAPGLIEGDDFTK